ncbi:MAG: pseudouridine synthase [Lachnospiraceae bacterium]|nr:pseudouridine synthase [Lachnospiraceae bacterium]
MEDWPIRINHYLAKAGICSRREADKLIQAGLVKIDGRTAKSGDRVEAGEQVTLRNSPVMLTPEIHVLAYYKPVGITCTQKDVHAKKTVTEELRYPVRVTYAGRLDRDSEGLLLMTNDGELINGLMRAANFHEKEYLVKVSRELTEEFIQKMEKGVYLEELKQTTRACRLERIGKYTFTIVLTQGLNRQIRRMCQTLGYEIISLKRIRVANVTLGKLKPGEYRRLEGEELNKLYSQVFGTGEGDKKWIR